MSMTMKLTTSFSTMRKVLKRKSNGIKKMTSIYDNWRTSESWQKKKGGTSSQKKKRKRIDYSADNAKDAVLKLIHGKKMSKKINLAVLEELIPKSEGKEEEET
mmetsp:Transcript_8850/g.13210  ORF Transcript_8850/g.13210 Transcript_8850/m.13210 type:complete len:103 (+) Transcript_8850:1162-1470(+)